jgi:hypothetical protein
MIETEKEPFYAPAYFMYCLCHAAGIYYSPIVAEYIGDTAYEKHPAMCMAGVLCVCNILAVD